VESISSVKQVRLSLYCSVNYYCRLPTEADKALLGACYAALEVHFLPVDLKSQNYIGNDRIVSLLKR